MPSQSVSYPVKASLPTPEATPTKRSHVEAFGDESLTSTAKSSKPFTSLIQPTKRQLFFNTPKWSIAYKGVDATTPIDPQPTRLWSPPVSVSPRSLAPPSPELQTLQNELAEALPSDVLPSPESESDIEDTEEVDDEVQVTGLGQVRRVRVKRCGVQLSIMEYERFLESLLDQVSFTKIDQHVASNRGRKVFRRVLKEMFHERIEDV